MKRRGQGKRKAAGLLLAAAGTILIIKAVPLAAWYGLFLLLLCLLTFFLFAR